MVFSQEADRCAALTAKTPHRDASAAQLSRTHRAWPYIRLEPGAGA
jgi:hypothetical protein